MAGAISESIAPLRVGAGTEIAAAFPADGTEPDTAVRFALMERLHRHYTSYLAGAESFLTVPRLGGDPLTAATEDAWLRWEDRQVDPAGLPESAEGLADWFAALRSRHVQPAFCRYLADEATIEEIALFFLAEELVDSRFDDLVALAQIGSTGTSKLTMAENYWDEMGEGKLEQMHTRLFEHSARYMRGRLELGGVDISGLGGTEVYENANLVLMYGVHRHLTPRLLAAMGLMEYTAPVRFQAMVDGCSRLAVPDDVIHYQRIHVHVDADHGAEWLENVLIPLAHHSPEVLREIGMGALTRERVANAYYERVWRQMRALR
ncbi:iron-containing redox enzyme family protein [Streptomyces kaniharaensis]|uniref:Iron-containing redox enzyme family protein n=1 Tax=Streptomyces kaniharaensis TaxID=212423 RepID=A0A6N7KJV6_9ACTN|nr:iron-containing redox enzyme family protein [Streptomyces kaniharaensis]MQS10728.1 iron-containing redox enzyme family protein [Streptomyces kaniharaensis]